MSFLRHGQIYPSDIDFKNRGQAFVQLRPELHRLDEFATGYSLAGCTPALPASASPALFMFNEPAETVNHHLSRAGEFSTGILRNFQPELTLVSQSGKFD